MLTTDTGRSVFRQTFAQYPLCISIFLADTGMGRVVLFSHHVATMPGHVLLTRAPKVEPASRTAKKWTDHGGL